MLRKHYLHNMYVFSLAKDYFYYYLLSNDDVGVARGTVSQEIRWGAGLKTGDFVKEKLGCAFTVERVRGAADCLKNFLSS